MAAEPAETSRRWWAPIGLGAALCVGCCLAPPLVAAGILGSGTLLVKLSWLEPLGFVLLALGVAGAGAGPDQTGHTTCAAENSGVGGCAGTGCGCTSTAGATR